MIQAAYNQWSASYDSDRNLTRDLDQDVTRSVLSSFRYQLILELGCGTGKNTEFLAQIGARVHAVDFSDQMLKQAKTKLKSSNITFSAADITQAWTFTDSTPDLITFNLVLEHVEDLWFVFSEASNCLAANGKLFVCELHPFRQYQGGKAQFQADQETVEIPAFVHHVSDFFRAAQKSGLQLIDCREWWHTQDRGMPPRLISFMFKKSLND
jgi:ubiquinone/menaquinone biosynthesis C-methylase UbiE